MEEEGGGAGRGEGGRDLLHHAAALAHPRADHPAGAGAQELDSAVEMLVELPHQTADRRRLGLQDLGGDLAGGPPLLPVRAHNAFLTAINDRSSRSALSGSSCTAASERACSGSGWISRKTPSAPAATAARASGSA